MGWPSDTCDLNTGPTWQQAASGSTTHPPCRPPQPCRWLLDGSGQIPWGPVLLDTTSPTSQPHSSWDGHPVDFCPAVLVSPGARTILGLRAVTARSLGQLLWQGPNAPGHQHPALCNTAAGKRGQCADRAHRTEVVTGAELKSWAPERGGRPLTEARGSLQHFWKHHRSPVRKAAHASLLWAAIN